MNNQTHSYSFSQAIDEMRKDAFLHDAELYDAAEFMFLAAADTWAHFGETEQAAECLKKARQYRQMAADAVNSAANIEALLHPLSPVDETETTEDKLWVDINTERMEEQV